VSDTPAPVRLAPGLTVGGGQPLAFIAGPCVIESPESVLRVARLLKEIAGEMGIPLVFKASFDKANRSSLASYRGPGLSEGLAALAEAKRATGLPVLTDVHEPAQAEAAAAVVDALGRAGMGGLAASLILSRQAPEGAWEAFRSYRARVIAAIQAAEPLDVDGWYGVGDTSVNGPVADALVLAREGDRPVFVFSPGEGVWHISARCPAGVRMDLEKVIRDLARSCDGDGGGHRCKIGRAHV
jgi:hypothetical protein